MRVLSRLSFAALLSVCAFAGPASAIDVYVGQSPTCDVGSLSDALIVIASSGPGPHTIHATNEVTYASQALFVTPVDLTIVGEHGCDDQTPDMPTINGDGAHSVITMSGSNNATLTLRNLTIRGGGNDGSGGGLDIRGAVNVTLDGTIVRDNVSDYGGGVYIENTVGSSSGILLMLPGSSIEANSATQLGGGVYAPGGRVRMHASDTAVRDNASQDGGGGLAIFGGELDVGKYVDAAVDGTASGAVIEGNSAGTVGGGVYLFGNTAGLFANELIVQDNYAQFAGGAIAASNGAYVLMQRDYPNAASTFNCPSSRECSRLSGNTAGYGAPDTHGGAIALYAGSRADIAQTLVRNNIAADGSAAWVDASTLNMEGVLLSGNRSFDTPTMGSGLIRAVYLAPASPPQLLLAFSTVVGNVETDSNSVPWPANDIIAQQNTVMSLHAVVFHDSPYVPTAYGPYTDDCIVRGSGGGLDPYGTHTRSAISNLPGFNLPDLFDFRLRSESLLTDWCDANAYAPHYRDLVLTPRCIDDPRHPDAYGTCDVGAYESDHLFGNGVD
jgi:hypothetical protein